VIKSDSPTGLTGFKCFEPHRSFWLLFVVLFVMVTGAASLAQRVYGQENRYVFSHLNVNDGLTLNQINCIYRDSKGFVWIGTNAGLNRFDGTSIEVFTSVKSANGQIKDNTINAITEDLNGNIWLGTGGGVSILNSQTYQFSDFTLGHLSTASCGDINFINTLAADREGNIWIGTNNGIFYNDLVHGKVERILVDSTDCTSQINSITSLVQDYTGNIWMSSKNGYLIRYDKEEKRMTRHKIPDESNKLTDYVTRLFCDRDNDLWVGNLLALYIFDAKPSACNTNFKREVKDPDKLKRIGAISQNVDGMVWVATDGGGMFVFDKTSFHVLNLKHQPFDDQQLASDGVSYVFCDRDGIVWVGTTKKGVNYYKKNINKFRIFKNISGDTNSLSNNDVNALVEDKSGNLWIGTDGGGLNYLDRKSRKVTKVFRHDPSGKRLSSNIIVTLFKDHLDQLWIGTYFGGLNKYDPVTDKFTLYRKKSLDSTTISDDRIYGIHDDKAFNIWAGTLGSGVNILNPVTGKIKSFTTKNSALCFDMITSIYRDKSGIIWLTTEYGLSSYDSRNDTFKTYQFQENSNSISNNNVFSCLEDSRGFFWICTNSGLNLLDRSNGQFRHFSAEDGLPSNSVHAIVEDKYHHLWLSTKNGISRMELDSVQDEQHFKFKFRNYDTTDGLQGKEFNRSSALCASDGEIFFGGPDGLNAFYPEEIKSDTSVAKMIFTDFRIFNKSIPYGQEYNNRLLLEKPIFNTEKVELKYKENSFTIEFTALNYFYPEKNTYTYKLDGFDKQWITTIGKNNSATYTNLNNGTYTFRVREINENSTGKEITLTIVVLPPFWKSLLAYLLYAMVILLVLLLLRHLILTRERSNARIEQERVEAQHIHEIDSLKIKFFTNISHEFRTPLTLIVGPVEKLQVTLGDKPEAKYLKLIEQNARRLLQMVNQLLDFRKMEVQGFEYNHFFGDIVSFLREAVFSFNYLSEQKNVKLVFTSNIKELNTYFDRDKLEKIIFNLLSNAFKFTPGNGEVTVSLTTETVPTNDPESATDTNLVIEVTDTGIGIPEDKLDKIFTRFFQVDNSGQVEKGTGIGLSLVAEFVKLHGGEIKV